MTWRRTVQENMVKNGHKWSDLSRIEMSGRYLFVAFPIAKSKDHGGKVRRCYQ